MGPRGSRVGPRGGHVGPCGPVWGPYEAMCFCCVYASNARSSYVIAVFRYAGYNEGGRGA